jgi:hypothetical protein
MFNAQPARQTPDLERLLLDTTRVASANSRIFILAVSWLAQYGEHVAKHRLVRLIITELESEHKPTLGMLLELAKTRGASNRSRFNQAIDACGTAVDARPLFDIERQHSTFAKLAERRASALSRKWGRWMADFELKGNAIRPAEWVAEHNPALHDRALIGGDLVASVLVECELDPAIVESHAELARRCGASRPAIREAIRRLQLAGRLREVDRGKSKGIALRRRRVA